MCIFHIKVIYSGFTRRWVYVVSSKRALRNFAWILNVPNNRSTRRNCDLKSWGYSRIRHTLTDNNWWNWFKPVRKNDRYMSMNSLLSLTTIGHIFQSPSGRVVNHKLGYCTLLFDNIRQLSFRAECRLFRSVSLTVRATLLFLRDLSASVYSFKRRVAWERWKKLVTNEGQAFRCK